MSFPADHVLGSQRNGLNHVGMNIGTFDKAAGPGRDINYPAYPDALLDWYRNKNIKSVRFMFAWDAVQDMKGGPVPATGGGYDDYWVDLIDVLNRLLARDIYVTLAPWQFNPASGDTDIVYDGGPFTAADFADFWSKFATAVNAATGGDNRVSFDLINEPHTHDQSDKDGDIGIGLPEWFASAQAAINAIRAGGATNTIFVPGMSYTDASAFTTNGSSTEWLKLTDPTENSAVTVHCYTGLGSTNPTVLRDACSGLVDWARAEGIKVHVGEIALDAGDNGRPVYRSTFGTAQTQWADRNDFCTVNNDVIIGWNWWGNSAPDWWNQGDSEDPEGYHWGLTLDAGATQTVYMDLIETSL